jgi:branched-chain amino acid aminotransferase
MIFSRTYRDCLGRVKNRRVVVEQELAQLHASGTKIEAVSSLSIWKDGNLIGAEGAAVSVWDHGFLYGDGIFEGIRIRSRRLYRIQDHLERLRRSARMLQLDVRYSNKELLAAIAAVAQANDLADAHVRVIVTRGTGLPSLDPRNCDVTTTLVLAYPFPPTHGSDPISLIVSSVVRKAPRSADPGAKTLNYLDGVLARLQANAAGSHDAVLLDAEGFVAEATASNIFVVASGVLSTPECTAALPGITRKTVLELADEAGVPAEVRRVTVGELYAADEVFMTGTGSGIVSVQAIDGRTLPTAPCTFTRTIESLYRDTWARDTHSVVLS